MKVHRDINNLPHFSNPVVTIGAFDGVHTGHVQIINQLKNEASAVNGKTIIITFHPHPRMVVNSEKKKIHLLNTLEEKIELIEKHDVDHLIIVPFDDAFSEQSAEDFIEKFLVEKFHPHTFIIGYDHRFGKGRKGNYSLLQEYASRFDYQVKEISKHVLDQVAISSTRIREAILNGDTTTANKYLGYDYFFEGEVVNGNKLGRELGYPTANITISDDDKLVPGNGIYAVEVEIKNDTNQRLKGMMSIGFRPTIGDSARTIEVNIFDFDKNIYGKILKVIIKKFLRTEEKYNSLDDLKNQLAIDKINSLEVLSG